MAGSASDYLEKKILDHVFGNTAYTAPTTLYFALFTDTNTPTQRDAGTVMEVSTGTWTNYARVAMTNNTTNFPNASGTTASKSNGTVINFASSAAVTGTAPVCTAYGIYDASTAGNLIFWADLGTNQTISNGNSVSFNTSSLTITCD